MSDTVRRFYGICTYQIDLAAPHLLILTKISVGNFGFAPGHNEIRYANTVHQIGCYTLGMNNTCMPYKNSLRFNPA